MRVIQTVDSSMESQMRSNHSKVKVGSQYINKHTKEMCTVTWKYFFKVGYEMGSGTKKNTHYKRFSIDWREVPPKCRKCGMDCKVIGGSQWLEYMCDKKESVEDDL